MNYFNQSPKYPLRWDDIKYVLGPSRLKEKWKKKTRYDIKRSFFPDIVDYMDIHTNISTVTKLLRKKISSGTYIPTGAARYRVEKSRGLCRLMVAPHPEELLILQAVSDTLYSQIKNSAPSKNAFFEPKDHSFSKTKGIEPEYGTFESWKNFLDKILGFRKESEYVIVTDVANYYDFIDFNSLRNVISSKKKINESLMDFLIYVLRNLSWQPDFMPFRPTGLPQIDTDAPRLLAHAYLFELDSFIEKINQKRYARFMDDIDAGVDNISQAKRLLRDIDLVLQSRNLRLNSGKTKILSSEEALTHFRVKENNKLDNISEILDKAATRERHLSLLIRATERMIDQRKFDDGNGEKVFKRIIGIANKHQFPVGKKIFREAVIRRPNLREVAFFNSALCGFGKENFDIIFEYMDHGLVCDDAFQMNLCKSLVSGKLVYDGSERNRIELLFDRLDKTTVCGIHSTLWFLSRYGKPDTFLNYANSLINNQAAHPFSHRIVGGYLARIIHDITYSHKLRLLLVRMGSRDAEDVFEFIHDISIEKSKASPLIPTLKAKNESYPLKCNHAKYMLINSVINNKHVLHADIMKIKSNHTHIISEPSYEACGLF